MCKNVEECLTATPIKCEVEMDGKSYTSDDFVAVLSKENGDASLLFNTDAITLGMAVQMISKAFVDAMSQLPEEERESVTAVLNGSYREGLANE